jgi:cell division transport system permease protein
VLSRTQVGYLLRESFAGFTRRKLTTGVTILIMASALLILALVTVVTINLGALLDNARGGIDLRVFLQDGLDSGRQAELQPRLVTIPGIASAHYISKEVALAELREQLGDEADVLLALDSNPLPASYQVTLLPDARGSQEIGRIREEIAIWPEVADVVFSQAWVAALERWSFLFRLASLIVGVVVFAAAVFVISNTVKLTMAAQARVIDIMKLVGATNWFIRTPFLCEGVIQGLLAGALAMAVLSAAYTFLHSQMNGLIFFSTMQIGGFVVFCVLLGLMGSWSAVHKYLRV